MYDNGKMRSVEAIPGIRGRRLKENDRGVNSVMINCMNFCTYQNAHSVKQ
jgi:hypothetical protein